MKGITSMEMTVKKEGTKLYVLLGGDIDHHEAATFRAEIDNIIFEERPEKIIFDFSNVKFMDSSGIGLVLGRYRLIKELGGSLEVKGAGMHIAQIFKMSGVDKIIEIN